MTNVIKWLGVFLLLAMVLAVDVSHAEARRFGGGGSFGGSRSFSKSFSKSTPSSSRTGAAGTTSAARSPRFGGMGGMFGGLLAGTLLGSMFFGMPFAGGGLMDMLLIGGLIFLALKLFRGRRPATQAAGRSTGMGYGGAGPDPTTTAYRKAQGAWGGVGAQATPTINMPEDFDEAEFLEGAKLAFNRLQQSWDARDLDDIAEFTTRAVQDEISAQAAADPGPSRTDVLMLEGRVLEVKVEGAATLATVYFEAVMREEQGVRDTEQVREVWHFRREDGVAQGRWLLDGLQQLEA